MDNFMDCIDKYDTDYDVRHMRNKDVEEHYNAVAGIVCIDEKVEKLSLIQRMIYRRVKEQQTKLYKNNPDYILMFLQYDLKSRNYAYRKAKNFKILKRR